MRPWLLITVLFFALRVHAAPDAGVPPTVAVLYFDVPEQAGELAAFKKGLAEMLITDLVADPRVRIVERARLEDVLGELKLSGSGKVDSTTAQRIGKLLGARYQVMGSLVPLGNVISFEARLVRVETGLVVKSTRARASLDDVFEAEQRLAAELAVMIAAAEAMPAPVARAGPSRPVKLKLSTAVKFARALDAKDHGDRAGAQAQLAAVVKEQPDFLLAQVDLVNLTR